MKNFKLTTCLIFGLSSFSLFAMDGKNSVTALLESPSMKNLKGTLKLHEMDNQIHIEAEISGLKPGAVHGFHVHEVGECKGPDFKSAGGHYNPTKHDHGGPKTETKHAGDLGNVEADKKGVAKLSLSMATAEKMNLKDFIGKAVVLHAKADDLKTQPSGDSGERIACGILKAN